MLLVCCGYPARPFSRMTAGKHPLVCVGSCFDYATMIGSEKGTLPHWQVGIRMGDRLNQTFARLSAAANDIETAAQEL